MDNNNPTLERAYSYSGFENAETAKHLRAGEICKVTGIGNSMTPILKSRQPVICIPVTEETELKKRDIVLCKVNGHFYLHLIWSIKKGKNDTQMFLIGNNHNHANGTISRSQIFGKVVEIL
jgi:hypothetical protein